MPSDDEFEFDISTLQPAQDSDWTEYFAAGAPRTAARIARFLGPGRAPLTSAANSPRLRLPRFGRFAVTLPGEGRKPRGRIRMSALALKEMPSPPLAPGDDVIDLDHLSRMTLGERSLEREVLALFDRQADILLPRIRRGDPAVAAAAAHTLKGSARRHRRLARRPRGGGRGAGRDAALAGSSAAADRSASQRLAND